MEVLGLSLWRVGGAPLSKWRYPHDPLHGENPEKNRARLLTGYRQALPPPLVGGGNRSQIRILSI